MGSWVTQKWAGGCLGPLAIASRGSKPNPSPTSAKLYCPFFKVKPVGDTVKWNCSGDRGCGVERGWEVGVGWALLGDQASGTVPELLQATATPAVRCKETQRQRILLGSPHHPSHHSELGASASLLSVQPCFEPSSPYCAFLLCLPLSHRFLITVVMLGAVTWVPFNQHHCSRS